MSSSSGARLSGVESRSRIPDVPQVGVGVGFAVLKLADGSVVVVEADPAADDHPNLRRRHVLGQRVLARDLLLALRDRWWSRS